MKNQKTLKVRQTDGDLLIKQTVLRGDRGRLRPIVLLRRENNTGGEPHILTPTEARRLSRWLAEFADGAEKLLEEAKEFAMQLESKPLRKRKR